MSATPGWYPDPSDERIMRFWNGNDWTTERSVPVVVDERPTTAGLPGNGAGQFQMPQISTLGWLFFGGAALVSLGAMLPWVEVQNAYGMGVKATPPGGSAAFLWTLAGIVVWLAWPARVGAVSKGRVIGLTVVGSFLALCVFTNFAAFGEAHDKNPGANISPGMGLWIYTVGTGLVVAAIVKSWLALRKAAPTGTGTVLA